jgi:hypothetical protein
MDRRWSAGTYRKHPAGYVMNTINFGKARFQAGIRIEGTRDSFVGNQINVAAADVQQSLVQVLADASYLDVLPSGQFQYRVGSDTCCPGCL